MHEELLPLVHWDSKSTRSGQATSRHLVPQWFTNSCDYQLQPSVLLLQKLVVPEDLAEINLQLWSSLLNNPEEWCDKRYSGTGSVRWPGSIKAGDAPDFVHRVLVLEPRWPLLQVSNPSTPPWAVERLPQLRLLDSVNEYCSPVRASFVCRS